MPPRYAYWTILVDDQPTAFRAGSQEDLMPTFKRLKEKHPSATMMWFQNGKLWPSRLDAQEAMRARGEMGRRGDERQGGGFRDRASPQRPQARNRPRASSERPEWTRKRREARDAASPQARKPASPEVRQARLETQRRIHSRAETIRTEPIAPSGNPRAHSIAIASLIGSRSDPSIASASPSGSRRDPSIASASPSGNRRDPSIAIADLDWKPKAQRPRVEDAEPSRLEWKPKGSTARTSEPASRSPQSPEKRKWVPKEEYKKSMGIEAKRDSKWRPGGEHNDPRQKYKDAKKAKWTQVQEDDPHEVGERREEERRR